jgi:hypothetical protein
VHIFVGGGAQFLWGWVENFFGGCTPPAPPQIIRPCRQRQQHRCQEIFNKISLQEFSCILQEIFVIFYTGMPNNLIIVKTPKEYHKFITMCDTIRSLKCTYAGSFIFDSRRKFLFLDFAARKRNIFSRPM